MKLVLIHGRAQEGKAPIMLQRQWECALKKGVAASGLSWPQDLSVVFAFYGDKLNELVEQINAPPIADVAMRGVANESEEKSFRHELLYEMAKGYRISDQK